VAGLQRILPCCCCTHPARHRESRQRQRHQQGRASQHVVDGADAPALHQPGRRQESAEHHHALHGLGEAEGAVRLTLVAERGNRHGHHTAARQPAETAQHQQRHVGFDVCAEDVERGIAEEGDEQRLDPGNAAYPGRREHRGEYQAQTLERRDVAGLLFAETVAVDQATDDHRHQDDGGRTNRIEQAGQQHAGGTASGA
jgi:hypothetical protein